MPLDESPIPMKENRRVHYGWIILVLAVLTVTGALGLARFGYTMILPSMKAGLGLNDARAGDLATANLAGYLAFAMMGGFLSTRYSPRVIISLFMALISLSMVMTGLAGDYGTAFLGRVLSGVGGGGANIPVLGVVMAWFAVSRRGLATGIAVSGSSFGLLLTGLAVPGILAQGGADGWRQAWFFLGGVSLVIALAVALFLRDTPGAMGMKPCGETAFVRFPSKTTPPSLFGIFKIVYRSLDVWHLAMVYLLFGFSYIIYATFFVRHLNWEIGFSIESAGRLWSLVGAVSVGSGLLWGAFSDRFGRKGGLALVFFLQALCYTSFAAWKSPAGCYVSAFLFSLTAWSIPAVMAAAVGDVVGTKIAPAALGFVTLFFGIGQVLGPFVAGRIADSQGSYARAFAVAAGASLAGGLLSLALRIRAASRSLD